MKHLLRLTYQQTEQDLGSEANPDFEPTPFSETVIRREFENKFQLMKTLIRCTDPLINNGLLEKVWDEDFVINEHLEKKFSHSETIGNKVYTYRLEILALPF